MKCFRCLVAVFFLPVLFAGCRGPQVNFSSKYQFSTLKRVAVVRFEGRGGLAAADLFAHSLLNIGPEVIERSRIEELLAEQRLGGSGILDQKTAKRIGSLLGVDALFLGTVTQWVQPQSYLVYDRAPVFSDESHSRASTPSGVSILTSSAQVGLTARLVDVETGTVVWSAHRTYEGFDTTSALSAITASFARSLEKLLKR